MSVFKWRFLLACLALTVMAGCAGIRPSVPFPLDNPSGQRAVGTIAVAMPSGLQRLHLYSDDKLIGAVEATLNQLINAQAFAHASKLREATIAALRDAGYRAHASQAGDSSKSALLNIEIVRSGFLQGDHESAFRPVYEIQFALHGTQSAPALVQERINYSPLALDQNGLFIPASPSRLQANAAELVRSVDESIMDIASAINAVAEAIARRISDPDIAPTKTLPPIALNHRRPAWGRCHAALIKAAATDFAIDSSGTSMQNIALQPAICLRNEQGKPVSYQLLRLPIGAGSSRLSIQSKPQSSTDTSGPEHLLAPSVTLLDGNLQPLLRYGADAFSLGNDQALHHSLAWSGDADATSTPQYLLISNDPKFTGRADAVLRRDNNGQEQLVQRLYTASGSVLAVIHVEQGSP